MIFMVGDKVKITADRHTLQKRSIERTPLTGVTGVVTVLPAKSCNSYGIAVGDATWYLFEQDIELVNPPQIKDSNPKDALGTNKAPLHCVPCGPLFEVGLGMMEGGRKYGAHNYRKIEIRASVYYDGFMRHIMAWWEGEDIDSDSGMHHITKAITDLFVLRDSQLMGNCVDDRPIRYPNGLGMAKLNEKAKKIVEKYPDCVEPFTEESN